jgi:ABC-type lipoprotein release transport system permease subunit
VTLSLGGLGVMNDADGGDRTDRILKALGATSRRILLDFFLEESLVTVSGALGLVSSGADLRRHSLPMPAFFAGLPVDTRTALTAILSLGTVALGAALPPAWRASNLTPVEALRFER